MITLRAVALGYGFLAFYAMLLPLFTTIGYSGVLPAITQLALSGMFFSFGFLTVRRSTNHPNASEDSSPPWTLGVSLLLAFIVLGSSLATTFYYTGQTPGTLFNTLELGESSYANYQSYNDELVSAGGGGALSPWFALSVFETVMSLIIIFRVVARPGRMVAYEWFLLLIVLISQSFSGLARGTGLEFFQVGTALLFAIMLRPNDRRRRIRRKVLIVGIPFTLLFLYLELLNARGSIDFAFSSSSDVQMEESWLSSGLGDAGVSAFLNLYGYFGFGFHYVSTFWSDVWLSGFKSIVLGIVPGGFKIDGISPQQEVVSIIEMGPRWHPDSILLISTVGLAGFMLICLVLGRVARKLELHATLEAHVLTYFIFLQLLSFPIGNFVWIDRSNVVAILIFVLGLFWSKRKNGRALATEPLGST